MCTENKKNEPCVCETRKGIALYDMTRRMGETIKRTTGYAFIAADKRIDICAPGTYPVTDGEFIGTFDINYCPICGREL